MKLGEICYINSGGTPSRKHPEYFKGSIPWAKISDIEKAKTDIINNTEENISEAGLKNIRNRLFPKGTLLFAMYGSIGKLAITGTELSTNQAILGIIPKNDDELFIPYLKSWFKKNKQKLINRGRGVALKNLSATIVRNLEIQLPSYDDQIRIATILSRAENLVAKRKESIELLDELLKSTFLEMFGDPVKNEKGLKKIKINEFTDVRIGPFGSLLHAKDYVVNGIPLINPSHIINSKIVSDNKRTLSTSKYNELENYHLRINDIVVARRGEIGRCAIVKSTEPLFCGTGSMFIRIKNKYSPLLLQFQIANTSLKELLESKAKGIIMKNLNSKTVGNLKVINPPEHLKNKFVKIVEKAESIKSKYKQSLAELENLYGSLSQRAFKGELDLSKIPIKEDVEIKADPVSFTTSVKADFKVQKLFSKQELLSIIKSRNGNTFNFNELWDDLEKADFIEMPTYDEIKDMVFMMLEDKEPILSQSFDEDKKEIVLKGI